MTRHDRRRASAESSDRVQARRDPVRLQNAVQERDDGFDAFLNDSPAPTWIKDDRGRVTYVNRAFERFFGRPSGFWVGKTDAQIWDAETAGRNRETEASVLRTGAPLETIEEVPDLDGRSHEWVVVRFPFLDAFGRRHVGGAAVDVTAHRRTEQRTDACNRVARVLAEHTSLTAAAPRILEVICELLNWGVGELWQLDSDGAAMHLLGTWQRPALDVREFTEAARKTAFGCDVGLPGRLWSSRQPIWISDVASEPWFRRRELAPRAGLRTACGVPVIATGTVVGAMIFFSDRNRERDEELVTTIGCVGLLVGLFLERLRVETRMQAIVETAIDGIALLDDRGRIRLFNPAAERLFGYSSAEVLAQDVRMLIPASPNETAWHPRDTSASARQHLAGVRCETLGRRKDGAVFPLSLSMGEMGLGAVRMFVGIFRDLTDFKNMQEEIVRTRSLAAIGETVATIGHEVKTPLAAISAPLQLILRDIDPRDPRYGVLTGVVDQVNRLANTVHRLLLLTRP